MSSQFSRRTIVRSGLIAGLLIPATNLLTGFACAAGMPLLDPSDPSAQALGFVTDADKVDGAANPMYKPAQKCRTCAQFQGKSSDASAACAIFAGKSVPSTGWCRVWAAKT